MTNGCEYYFGGQLGVGGRTSVRASIVVTLAATLVVVALIGGCSSNDDNRSVLSPIELRVGQSTTTRISTHCGYEWLEVELNGQLWTTTELGADSAGNPTELTWPQGQPETELELHLIDDDTLEVRAVGTDVTHTYRPGSNPPGCE
jgi:hypothetical protein